MRNITKLRRNSKALSPIFATLILIAIAVIAGIVVYMFTSGTIASMTGGGTAGQEKMAIQAAGYSANALTIYAQSTGGGPITVDSLIIKNSAGNVVTTLSAAGGTGYSAVSTATVLQALTTVSVTNTTAAAFGMFSGNTYSVTVVSKQGGSFVSPSFTP